MTFTVAVELEIAGAWLDITKIDDETKLLAASPVTITRGRSDQQGRTAPTEVRFTYLDNNAVFDGDNPASPYYRQVGLGTPMRILVDTDVRAVVEIVGWDPSWDESENAVTVAVVGAGVLRRLEDGQKPLRSAAYRAFMAPVNDPYRVAYWPFEEESGATTVSSPTPGATVSIDGSADMEFRSVESMSSAGLAQFGDVFTFLTFNLPTWTNTLGQHFVGSLVRWPEGGLNDGLVLWRWYFTGGDVDWVDLLHNTGDVLRLQAYSGGVVVSTVVVSDWTGILDNRESFLFCTFHQNGADIDVRLRATTATSWLLEVSATISTRTLGRMYKMVANTGQGQAGWAIGHVIVGSNKDAFGNFVDDLDSDASYLVTGARGYEFETAGKRILRLADEEDIPITVVGTSTDTARLGPQGSQTAPEMIYAATDTDQGILFEARSDVELVYRTRVDLYNQTPVASLSYGHLARRFRPASDDLRVTNSVTAQRSGGSTGVYTVPDDDWWHWTTQDPPDGAGLRESEATLAVAEDGQLRTQAAWRAHLASWREKRFRLVVLELANPRFDAADKAAVRALNIGDVLAIDTAGAPPYVPYTQLRLMVQGYTETVTKHTHTFAINTTPADIFEVSQVDALGSQLQNTVDADDTSLLISPPSVGRAWSTSSTDLPYDIQVNGDPMRVTAIATDTPAFVAAGTNAAGNNASVAPALPAGIAAGNLMLLFAGIRNSGTGTVNLPTGWLDLVNFGNVRLMYRYYRSGDSAPTVAFTGGVANADTFARTFGFGGLSHIIATGSKAAPAAVTSLNSSAQNMAYSAFSLASNRTGASLIFAWKQDDWTGVAAPSGFTEMDDTAATTGDDLGHAAYYDLTGQSEAAGSLVVTGGASAISRTIALHLRPTQTATVTRGIAGTAVSHSPGEEIRGWRMGVTGL